MRTMKDYRDLSLKCHVLLLADVFEKFRNNSLTNYELWIMPKSLFERTKLKVGLSPTKKNCIICFIESPIKMMKNVFYFILKVLFIVKIFKFLS